MATMSSIVLALFLFSAISYVLPADDCPYDRKYFYIANKVTGKVLADGDRTKFVGIYDLDDSIYESYYNNWEFYPAPRTGLFVIGIKCCMGALGVNLENNTLYMSEDNDSLYQQWFLNADGTIVNGGLYNYGLKVNRSGFGQEDVLYLGSMDVVTVDDLFEIIISPWQVGS